MSDGLGFGDPVVGGITLLIPAIESPNFVSGVSGWQIARDGSAQFNNLSLRGTFTGTDYVINSAGVFLYTAAPAAGNLVLSIAPATGTDGEGNAYTGPGVAAYGTDGGTAFVGAVGGQEQLILFSGQPIEGAAGAIYAQHSGTGAAEFLSVSMFGPAVSTASHTDQIQIALFSANAGGTSSANGNLYYRDTGGTPHQFAYWDSSGFHIVAGLATAAQPGTGTVASPAVAETWHSLAAGNGWSGTVYYRLTPMNEVQIYAALASPAAAVNNVTIVTLPAGYRPASIAMQWNATHTAAANFEELFSLATSGALQSTGVGPSATVIINESVPLDVP